MENYLYPTLHPTHYEFIISQKETTDGMYSVLQVYSEIEREKRNGVPFSHVTMGTVLYRLHLCVLGEVFRLFQLTTGTCYLLYTCWSNVVRCAVVSCVLGWLASWLSGL